MKLSTRFNILTYLIVFFSIALANHIGELNSGYVIGLIAGIATTISIVLSSESNKIEKKWGLK